MTTMSRRAIDDKARPAPEDPSPALPTSATQQMPSRTEPSSWPSIVLALPCPAPQVQLATRIRSTVLASSLSAIDALGLRDEYLERLPREDHPAIRSLVVGEWVPMQLGISHYRAIDALGLSTEQARDNGRRVAEQVQKSYLATMVKTLGLGITPWSILGRAQSILDRLLFGATVALYRVGPKDARLEIHGASIAEFDYVRAGWAGMIEGGLDLVARKTSCRDLSSAGTASVAAYKITWA
jgi:hypothetical protein